MSVAIPLEITELIERLIDPAVREPISSSHLAIRLLADARSAWSGHDLPSAQNAYQAFRAALIDEGDLGPAQVSEPATELRPVPTGDLHCEHRAAYVSA